MRGWYRIGSIGVLAVAMMLVLGSRPGMAQSGVGTAQARAHVYLLRGLMNIFSLGMDTLAAKIQRRGIYATVHNHAEWQALADQAAAAYHAGKEGPIIIIGYSLGADAVMEMSAYLGRKGVQSLAP
jgi:thioesterase domain-containing protein